MGKLNIRIHMWDNEKKLYIAKIRILGYEETKVDKTSIKSVTGLMKFK